MRTAFGVNASHVVGAPTTVYDPCQVCQASLLIKAGTSTSSVHSGPFLVNGCLGDSQESLPGLFPRRTRKDLLYCLAWMSSSSILSRTPLLVFLSVVTKIATAPEMLGKTHVTEKVRKHMDYRCSTSTSGIWVIVFIISTTRKSSTSDAKKVVSHHKPRLMTPVVTKTRRH
jgi:hypothetical protein